MSASNPVPQFIAFRTVSTDAANPQHDTVTTYEVDIDLPSKLHPEKGANARVDFYGREIDAGKPVANDKAKDATFEARAFVSKDATHACEFELPPVMVKEGFVDEDEFEHAPVYHHEGRFTAIRVTDIPAYVATLRGKLAGFRKRWQYLALGQTRVLSDALALAYNRSAARTGDPLPTLDAMNIA